MTSDFLILLLFIRAAKRHRSKNDRAFFCIMIPISLLCEMCSFVSREFYSSWPRESFLHFLYVLLICIKLRHVRYVIGFICSLLLIRLKKKFCVLF